MKTFSIIVLTISLFISLFQVNKPFCSFMILDGPNKGTYDIQFLEEEGFCFNDFENEQYVIEIHGSNFIDLMIILENLEVGRHDFAMEMQVAIDMSLNGGEDYFGFHNYYENKEGFIEIEKIDSSFITGRFEGLFYDGSVEEDLKVKMEGQFSVRLEGEEE